MGGTRVQRTSHHSLLGGENGNTACQGQGKTKAMEKVYNVP